MANNSCRQYLVIAEVERQGFIMGRFKKYWPAVELANELLLYGELFPWKEPEKIILQLQNRKVKEYPIKGNQLYFDKGIYGSTDGKYSVIVLPINTKNFSLETFIRERENHSIVFSPEQYWAKKWSGYFENFPSAVTSQVSLEKSEFRKGIEDFISSQNESELDWSFIHNHKKERDKLFKKINTGQIENLLAIGLMLRAHQIMDRRELLPDAEKLINKFADEFSAALRMNTIIFRNIGDGVKGLSNPNDKHWNTINDTQILFALLYNGGNINEKYLVTEDKGIAQACISSGLGDHLLKIRDYKQRLNID